MRTSALMPPGSSGDGVWHPQPEGRDGQGAGPWGLQGAQCLGVWLTGKDPLTVTHSSSGLVPLCVQWDCSHGISLVRATTPLLCVAHSTSAYLPPKQNPSQLPGSPLHLGNADSRHRKHFCAESCARAPG